MKYTQEVILVVLIYVFGYFTGVIVGIAYEKDNEAFNEQIFDEPNESIPYSELEDLYINIDEINNSNATIYTKEELKK